MNKFALTIPWGSTGTVINDPSGQFSTLGSFISGLFNIAFMIAFFLAFIWLVWGAFQYIFASGNKDSLGKARSRMIWAIVGFLMLAIAFALSQFIEQILGPRFPSPLSLVTPAYAQDHTPAPLPTVGLEQTYGFGNIPSLGEGLNKLVLPAFSLATAAVVIYFLIGAFIYLTSGGSKDGVEKARNMITHAIIGFVLLIAIFLIMQFIPEFFGIKFSLF